VVGKLGSNNDLDTSMEKITVPPNGAEIKRPFEPSRCLFCTIDASTVELNVKHMQNDYGSFIPDQEDLVDFETLLKYLFTVSTESTALFQCEKFSW
jgi:pre-60S factor REI1